MAQHAQPEKQDVIMQGDEQFQRKLWLEGRAPNSVMQAPVKAGGKEWWKRRAEQRAQQIQAAAQQNDKSKHDDIQLAGS